MEESNRSLSLKTTASTMLILATEKQDGKQAHGTEDPDDPEGPIEYHILLG